MRFLLHTTAAIRKRLTNSTPSSENQEQTVVATRRSRVNRGSFAPISVFFVSSCLPDYSPLGLRRWFHTDESTAYFFRKKHVSVMMSLTFISLCLQPSYTVFNRERRHQDRIRQNQNGRGTWVTLSRHLFRYILFPYVALNCVLCRSQSQECLLQGRLSLIQCLNVL